MDAARGRARRSSRRSVTSSSATVGVGRSRGSGPRPRPRRRRRAPRRRRRPSAISANAWSKTSRSSRCSAPTCRRSAPHRPPRGARLDRLEDRRRPPRTRASAPTSPGVAPATSRAGAGTARVGIDSSRDPAAPPTSAASREDDLDHCRLLLRREGTGFSAGAAADRRGAAPRRRPRRRRRPRPGSGPSPRPGRAGSHPRTSTRSRPRAPRPRGPAAPIELEHRVGLHAVRVERRVAGHGGQVVLEQVERPGRPVAAGGVDDDEHP